MAFTDFAVSQNYQQQQHMYRASATAPAWLRSAKLHIRVMSRPGVVLVVSMSRVTHVPVATTSDPGTLTLCPSCDIFAHANSGPCSAGNGCIYVHADVRGRITEYMPHERALAHTYRRLGGGDAGSAWFQDTVTVAHNANAAGADARAPDVVRPVDVLLTRAFTDPGRALVHCAHFTKKGRCDRGSDCLFVHCVAAAAAVAVGHVRAPPPCYASSTGRNTSAHTNTNNSPEVSMVSHLAPPSLQQAHHQHHHLRRSLTIGGSAPTSPCSACDAAATTPVRPQPFTAPEGGAGVVPELPPPAVGTHTCTRAFSALSSPPSQPAAAAGPLGRRRASSFALVTGDGSVSSSGVWRHSPYAAKPHSLGSPPALQSPESSMEWQN